MKDYATAARKKIERRRALKERERSNVYTAMCVSLPKEVLTFFIIFF